MEGSNNYQVHTEEEINPALISIMEGNDNYGIHTEEGINTGAMTVAIQTSPDTIVTILLITFILGYICYANPSMATIFIILISFTALFIDQRNIKFTLPATVRDGYDSDLATLRKEDTAYPDPSEGKNAAHLTTFREGDTAYPAPSEGRNAAHPASLKEG